MHKFKVIDYFDVWGNEEDGFEVNNLSIAGEIEVENIEKETLLNELKEFGFFNDNVTLDMLDIENWSSDFIEFFEAKNRYPLCRLEEIL